ncbi:MAG: toxin-antitoxin system YwqK family antitoxin [Lutibacter sp.]
MKTNLTLVLLAIFCSLKISAQIEKKYYSNTTILKETGNLKNGLKDGIWETFYENGKLETVGNYTDDEKNGEWKVYFDNEQLAAVGNYTSTKFPTPGTWKFYTKEGKEEVYKCPKPTSEQFLGACHTIYVKQMALNPKAGVSYGYQESIWEMSCAVPGQDIIESAKPKIQLMWNTNRTFFRCYGYSNLTSTEKNIAKFSLDTGFSAFVTEAVKRYELDMNFIDPGDHGKTILDFIKDQRELILNRPPVDQERADEYQRFYKLLKSNGAKHASEL